MAASSLPKGELVVEDHIEALEAADLDSVRVRSPLVCEAKVGVCAKCYGRDLARGTFVNIGEAVGVIAAQSVGEPGTQLTMRTFHVGGAAQKGSEQSSVEASMDAKVKMKNRNVLTNSKGETIVFSRNLEVVLEDDKGRERANYRVPYGARLLVSDKKKVKKGTKLADWDPYTKPIITDKAGFVNFVDLVDNVSMNEVVDEETTARLTYRYGLENQRPVARTSSPYHHCVMRRVR